MNDVSSVILPRVKDESYFDSLVAYIKRHQIQGAAVAPLQAE